MRKSLIVATLLCLSLTACQDSGNIAQVGKSPNPGNGGGGGNKPGKVEGCVAKSHILDGSFTSCKIRLVKPDFCDLVDLSAGKTYDISWEAEGTCDVPWRVLFAGSPFSTENLIEYEARVDGEAITAKRGIIRIDANDIKDLKSNDGYYHWVVMSKFGTHPASKNFKIQK